MRDLALALAQEIREAVKPLLGKQAGRNHASVAVGGDITFEIDSIAESRLERFISESAPELAFYSEDRGLVEPSGQADHVLVVDPIDGTRPALAGLESACVSVAIAPLNNSLTMGDVQLGCIQELKSGTVFLAEKGRGVTISGDGAPPGGPAPSDTTDLSRMFWTLGFRGRPARLLVEALGDLIDTSSVGGGVFDLGSATFDMTRLLTGQLDGYLDIGARIIDDIPHLQQEFERVGNGAVLNNSPHDLAAAVLCLKEGGAVVTDAYGGSLDKRPLLGSDHQFQMSCVAASNPTLHKKILDSIDLQINKLARRMSGDPHT